MQKRKSFLQSGTIWGIFFTLVIAIGPYVGEAIKEQKLTVDTAVKIIGIIAATGLATIKRIEAKDALYTPEWMPGPNEKDPIKTEEPQ